MYDDTSFFPENLTAEVKRFGGISAVANATGLSRQMLKRYMDGLAEPGLSALLKISSTLGVTVESLCGIVSDAFTTDQFSCVPYFDLEQLPEHHRRSHQRYSDLIISNFLLSPKHYSDLLLTSFEDLRLFYIDNNHMSPSLKIGDIAIISTSETHRKPCDGLFLFVLNESLMLRRLQNTSPDTSLAMTDGPNFESFALNLADTRILGKIVMVVSLH